MDTLAFASTPSEIFPANFHLGAFFIVLVCMGVAAWAWDALTRDSRD